MPVDLENLSSKQILITLPDPYTKGKIYTIIGKASKIKDGDYLKHEEQIVPINDIGDADIIEHLNTAKEPVPSTVITTDEIGVETEVPNPDVAFAKTVTTRVMSLREQGLECFKRQLAYFIEDVEETLKEDASEKALGQIESQIESQIDHVDIHKGAVS